MTDELSQLDALPPRVRQLCDALGASAAEVDQQGNWPRQQIEWCRDAGVFGWFIPKEFGGSGWSELELLQGYLALSQSCLTTTFILTQWAAACRRIVGSSNRELRQRLLPELASGRVLATVGISHLTTSRQHVAKPVLTATQHADGDYRLNGFTPWVTSASAADVVVLGATLDDGKQMIVAVPTAREGVVARPGERLVALTSSCTDRIDLTQVRIGADEIVAGPIENVMQTNSGGGAGGLQTSTLAVGLSLSAVGFLVEQAVRRPDLHKIADKMKKDVDELLEGLYALTRGAAAGMTAGDLRQRANSLVLRSTQAALTAAKGAGFVAAHPTGRWAREALFFLVWSCPQPIVTANLCELAQIA